jgi:hypothetical protein
MKTRYIRLLSLLLAALLQLAPLVRTLLPQATGLAPSAWAIILKIGVGAVALAGFDAVSQASSIAISPPNATVGVPFVGVVTYSGGHAGSVASMALSNNCLSSLVPLFAGLSIQYLNANQAQVSGTPTSSGTFGFSVTVWEGGGCGGGHNDTRGTTLVVGSGGSGGQAPSNPTLPNTIGQVGSAVQMSGVSAGNPTPQYQWWTALGVPIAGATNPTLVINNLQLTNAGLYTLTASNSMNVSNSFFLLPKASCFLSVAISGGTNFTALNFTNYAPAGQAFTMFSYVTNGTTTTTNHYSWTYNYVNTISTSNTVPFTGAAATPARSGIYTVTFNTANSGGAVVSGQNYDSYWAFGYPPLFAGSLPANTNAAPGSSLALTIPVAGSLNVYNAAGGSGGFTTNTSAPCVFWYQNGTLIASQTYACGPTSSTTYSNSPVTATLTLTNVSPANNGSYTAVATNYWGSITSTPAILTVSSAGYAPVITTNPPAALQLLVGQSAALSVTVTGTPPFSFGWLKDNANLTDGATYSGAFSNLLTLTGVVLTNAGKYSVAIANSAGAVTSSVASVSVALPPTVAAGRLAGNLQITANTFTNLAYRVDAATNLSAPVWLPVLTNNTGASGNVGFQTNPASGPAVFYRVVFP